MELVRTFFELGTDLISAYKAVSGWSFWLVVLLAVVLAAVGWAVCTKWTLLWNKAFTASKIHHAMCSLAAVVTFTFVLVYVSLKCLYPVALTAVNRWSKVLTMASGSDGGSPLVSSEDLQIAHEWGRDVFLLARHQVFAANKKGEGEIPFLQDDWQRSADFGGYALNQEYHDALVQMAKDRGLELDPGELGVVASGRGLVLPGNGVLGEITAKVWANSAASLFREMYPAIALAVWPARQEVATSRIQDDRASYLRQGNDSYPLQRATDIARTEVRKSLEERAPRIVTVARLGLVIVFVLVQAIPFAAVGIAAYIDLMKSPSIGSSQVVARARYRG
jgi:hypothetical protein